jgi:hypothetical protein
MASPTTYTATTVISSPVNLRLATVVPHVAVAACGVAVVAVTGPVPKAPHSPTPQVDSAEETTTAA